MPYKFIPRVMVREIITQANEFLNVFGNENNIAGGMTLRNIINNLPHIDFKDLLYEFGQYVQIHVDDLPTNTMRSRTIGAISLGPRSIQGKYNYISLETGMKIDGRVVGILPITSEVINRVETLGKNQNQPFSDTKTLTYEWHPETPFTFIKEHL